MDTTVPAGAALLLDLIGDTEAPRGYDTIYGNNQGKLPKPLTSMTVDEVIAAGPDWTHQYRSSAAGRYQFMNDTLKGLKAELGLRGGQVFDADLQDRLAYHLLKRRGYERFVSGGITGVQFAKALAQEWASFPVLAKTQGRHREVARGETYYAGDKLNRALITPEKVENALLVAKMAARPDPAPAPIPVEPPAPDPDPIPPSARTGGAVRWVVVGVVGLLVAIGLVWLFFTFTSPR